MSCYHKFVVTDTEAFLSNADRPRKLLVTCKNVLQDVEAGHDIRINAAKLLEVVLLQCPGRLDEVRRPFFGDKRLLASFAVCRRHRRARLAILRSIARLV